MKTNQVKNSVEKIKKNKQGTFVMMREETGVQSENTPVRLNVQMRAAIEDSQMVSHPFINLFKQSNLTKL